MDRVDADTFVFVLMFCSDELKSSTHALTMYRYNYTMDGTEYKVGKNTTNHHQIDHSQSNAINSNFREQIYSCVFVDIWDTAGQESFNELHPTYYYGAHVCVLVFDSQRKVTYQNLRNWYKEMRDQCPYIPCMVIANKIDMDTKVTGRRYNFISEIGCPFEFVSAADGTNVVAIFKQALQMGLEYKNNPHEDDFMFEVDQLLSKDHKSSSNAAGGDDGDDQF